MCDPVILFGAPAASAATVSTFTAATGALTSTLVPAKAATSGLFGSGGLFGFGQTFASLSAATGAFGAIRQGKIAEANFKYQAHMADYQAKVHENNALMQRREAEFKADMFDDRLKVLLAKQNTAFAKGNVVINQDTPLEISVDTASEGALERLAILYRGETAASAEEAAAGGQRFAAVNARANAKRAPLSGVINAATHVGTGAYRLGLLT